MTFAAIDGGWAAGGGMALLALISLIRFLLSDTGASNSLQQEIKGLRDDLARERADRREDIARMNEQIVGLTAAVAEQRSEKHRLNNELGQAQMLLGVVIQLADKCTCGALEVVRDLMARIPTPFNPNPNRPPSEAST